MKRTPLELDWLPPHADFEGALSHARTLSETGAPGWHALRALSGHRLDFLQTTRIDRLLRQTPPPPEVPRLRLALLGSFTLEHLVPGLRIGALRRGLALEVHVPPYGQWRQEILTHGSGLAAFAPEAVLICSAESDLVPSLPLTTPEAEVEAALDAAIADLVQAWRRLRAMGAAVIQQLPIRAAAPLFGHFDRLVPASPGAMAAEIEHRLIRAARAEGVLILDPMAAARAEGIDALQDRLMWLHAKQHVSPAAGPWFGDQAARILAGLRGLTRKVLVLDLDNTLWGGVIGDDGLDGIVIGEGSARGEAFKAFQLYCKALRERGVLLAVSSKNDPARAEAAFDHPEMVLRRADFAAFVANWTDKGQGLQRIAQELNLGLDALVFFDDNPAERALLREQFPEVAVPEVPEQPEDYVRCLAASGLFETVAHTADDARRAEQYAANAERRRLEIVAPDMDSFLAGLGMEMRIGPVERVDLVRVTQLINKTNQFNLTTRRYTEAEVEAMIADPDILTFCVRLTDRFGDNGIVCVVLGRLRPDGEGGRLLEVDTWLMSCRVLGRRVEEAVAAVIAGAARDAGASTVVGCYRPTPKNGMVADLFPRLGFHPAGGDGHSALWRLDLAAPPPPPPHIRLSVNPVRQ
ncbi:HAD-IIIC family phosphatase [Cereibacter sphaeroides]|uniref:HAD-IIIC family phosphatase n=1 Tax=Cereibacter sphaeroides TaxID=1063 RepID=UPI001F1EC941|nr:HAD-IIIC family phosphatase [Cereibacter sphaeroides]MCE6960023.1 HAD-IIIC family phosphatase [Cereibacter sphaeroides]MCE6973108.1 HAD-IIIC family phosphatase [Cereibacter sphaeroides]